MFAEHTAPFWDDAYLSRRLLAAHLDRATDAASRRPEVVDASVDWLTRRLELQAGQQLLDLGCGPGLYAERFAGLGIRVTGLDISRTSLAYARRRARLLGLDIAYRRRDYLTLAARQDYHAVVMIYHDFGVLSDTARDNVLHRISVALRPGGRFAFDVRTPAWRVAAESSTTWSLDGRGFWRRGPYLELTRHFGYAQPPVHLRQTVIVDPDGQLSVYRFWDRLYSPRAITAVLEASGFQVEELSADLCGAPYSEQSEAMGVVARKI